MKKLKKWQLFSIIGATIAVVAGAILFMFLNGGNPSEMPVDTTPLVQKAKEGSVASSVLLTGNVTASNEQYIYYDSTKGDLENVLVNVGDQVTAGQALVTYKSAEAQAAYDAAARAVSKADRQLHDLQTNGVTVNTTGDEEADGASEAQAQRSVESHAVDNMNKAQATLNALTVTSTADGTVVEVNRDVSKSTTGATQTLVHIVSNGNLQIKGELSEYNLANLSVGQEVTITSKVYPDKKWTGKISYISNYPKDGQQAAAQPSGTGGSGTASGSKYPFTIDITSEIGELKQGFSVNIEVKNNTQGLIVPVSSVVMDGDKNYVWVLEKGVAKKTEVTLGNADAENQEISSGLTKDSKVIINPTDSLKDGQEVKSYEEAN